MILLGGCLVDETQIQLVKPCRVDFCDACTVYLTGGNQVIINASMSEVVAIMEKLGWMTDDAESGGEPFPLNVTEEERDELRSCVLNGFPWIAKDANGVVYAYKYEPIFVAGYWKSPSEDIDPYRRLRGKYADLPTGADGSVCIDSVLRNGL